MDQHTPWVTFEEDHVRQRTKNNSSSSSTSLSSSLSSLGSTTMERRMADFSAGLDVGQLAAQLQDKYAVLQDLHATSADLGWSSSVLHGVPQ